LTAPDRPYKEIQASRYPRARAAILRQFARVFGRRQLRPMFDGSDRGARGLNADSGTRALHSFEFPENVKYGTRFA
jgi:hypothetical protein